MSGVVEGPALWYLNRGSGVALLLVLTATVALGILSARNGPSRLIPRFVGQHLHRNLGVLGAALLAGHVVTAVVDEYVDVRWWQAFSPVGATYEPFWLGLGAVALDVILVAVLSSLGRDRLGQRAWHGIHLLGYLAWPLAMAHAIGMGTDATTGWGRQIGLACAAVVVLAAAARLGSDALASRRGPAREAVHR